MDNLTDKQEVIDLSSIAVVILNYNGKKFLEKFLPSVVAHSGNARLYLADNASTDDSLQFVQSAFPQIVTIELRQNYGFCGGYNRALKSIEAEYYVLLNSDVEVTANWLTPLFRIMAGNNQIGAVQPKIKSYHNPTHFEYAGAAGGFLDFLGYPFCRGRLFSTTEEDKGQYDQITPIFWASGACMFVRAELYQELGGLDEAFFAHMEEIDLCWRMQRAGFQVYFTPDSEVYHVGGGTLAPDSPRKVFFNFRNNLLMLYKNLPILKGLAVIVCRLCLDGMAGLKFLAERKPASTWAIVKAHFSFYQKLLSVSQHNVSGAKKVRLFPQSIVYQYYIKKKAHYSELLT